MLRRTSLLLVLAAAVTLAGAAESVKKVPAGSGGKLVLDLNAGGAVAISGSGGSEVVVSYSQECDPPCTVNVEEAAGGVKVSTDFTKKKGNQRSNIDLEIKVPSRFDIELDSVGGGLSIDGVEGKFSGRTNGGELNLIHVRGEAELTTLGGEIQLKDSELDGFLKTNGGEVTFENVVGDVRGSSLGGNVRYKNVHSKGGRLQSPDKTGSDLAELDADTVQISTKGGEIEVEEAPEGAELLTMGGDIRVRGARRFVRAKTMGGNIDITSQDGWVNATTMGGDVEVHVTGSGGDVTLTSMSGDIVLTVPRGTGLDLDLELAFTRNSGKDYKITAPGGLGTTVTPEWDHEHGTPRKYVRMNGPVNGGGHTVKVRTINGNVEIREGT